MGTTATVAVDPSVTVTEWCLLNETTRVEGPLFDVLNSFLVLHASLKEESVALPNTSFENNGSFVPPPPPGGKGVANSSFAPPPPEKKDAGEDRPC